MIYLIILFTSFSYSQNQFAPPNSDGIFSLEQDGICYNGFSQDGINQLNSDFQLTGSGGPDSSCDSDTAEVCPDKKSDMIRLCTLTRLSSHGNSFPTSTLGSDKNLLSDKNINLYDEFEQEKRPYYYKSVKKMCTSCLESIMNVVEGDSDAYEVYSCSANIMTTKFWIKDHVQTCLNSAYNTLQYHGKNIDTDFLGIKKINKPTLTSKNLKEKQKYFDSKSENRQLISDIIQGCSEFYKRKSCDYVHRYAENYYSYKTKIADTLTSCIKYFVKRVPKMADYKHGNGKALFNNDTFKFFQSCNNETFKQKTDTQNAYWYNKDAGYYKSYDKEYGSKYTQCLSLMCQNKDTENEYDDSYRYLCRMFNDNSDQDISKHDHFKIKIENGRESIMIKY